MYQTNSTNNANSASKSKSHVHLQKDLWEDGNNTYHPDHLMIDQVFGHYHQTLMSRPKLLDMLVHRTIDPDFADRFNIGFSDRTLGFELMSTKSLLGSRNRGHLQRLGLLKDSGHEYFHGAIVFPYRNDDEQIVGAYGRRPKQQRRSPAYHLYWNAQQVTFFNAGDQCLPESVILCKSALDALTLLTVGINNVVASMGMRGFNDVQLSRLLNDGVQSVYIAFDNTPMGDHYARLVAQALDAIDILCFRIKLPLGQDVNQLSMSRVDLSSVFNCLVKMAAPFKQHHGSLVPSIRKQWLTQIETIADAISFYLDVKRQDGLSPRTLNTNRIHLERFNDYCCTNNIQRLLDLSVDVLEGFQCYLETEKNIFTGKVISNVTQKERMNAVLNMLSRLHYYGVFHDHLIASARNGRLN